MKKQKFTGALTAGQKEDLDQARLKKISLKWAKITRDKAGEELFARRDVSDMTDPSGGYELCGYELYGSPARATTICLDLDASDVELALATNGNSLRRATVTALLAALIVDNAPALDANGAV
jgi:hypothetical protein